MLAPTVRAKGGIPVGVARRRSPLRGCQRVRELAGVRAGVRGAGGPSSGAGALRGGGGSGVGGWLGRGVVPSSISGSSAFANREG